MTEQDIKQDLHDAFIKGIKYSSNKYEAHRSERFTGGDVADFLYMEAEELSDTDITTALASKALAY
jgi:hypothetical protein